MNERDHSIPRSEEFRPAAWLRGPHLETILPTFWPAPAIGGEHSSLIVPVAPGVSLKLELSRPRQPKGTVLLLHGVGGDAGSGYMRRCAAAAVAEGWLAVRMNGRACGGTEALSRTLPNGAQSDDVGAVLDELDRLGFERPFAAVGFSLGGNLILRYAGRAGADCVADAVAAINPTIQLSACVEALERPGNRGYDLFFTRSLLRRLRRYLAVWPELGPAPRPLEIRSVRGYDDRYTAPSGGWSSSAAYYEDASSSRFLHATRVPALLLSARNDPFVPPALFERSRLGPTDSLRVVLTDRGGHTGYWQTDGRGSWVGEAVMGFFAHTLTLG